MLLLIWPFIKPSKHQGANTKLIMNQSDLKQRVQNIPKEVLEKLTWQNTRSSLKNPTYQDQGHTTTLKHIKKLNIAKPNNISLKESLRTTLVKYFNLIIV